MLVATWTAEWNSEKGKKFVAEMKKLEDEYFTASKTARKHLNARRDDKSVVTSDILSDDMVHKLNITNYSETYQKSAMREVNNQIINVHETTPFAAEITLQNTSSGTHRISVPACIDDDFTRNMSIDQTWTKGSHCTEPELCIQSGHRASRCESAFKATENESTMDPIAATFEPMASCTPPSIGQDQWRQLKRLQIPVFYGDKRNNQSWKAAFLACIDSAPAPGEYKLL